MPYWVRMAGLIGNDDGPIKADLDVKPGNTISPAMRVALLWLLVAAVFLVFNVLYWPVHLRQRALAPENMVAYAEELREAGQTRFAAEYLARGIRQYRPPLPEAYELLADCLRDLESPEAAAGLAPQIAFHRAWVQAAPQARIEGFREAIGVDLAAWPLAAPEASAAPLIRAAAGSFAAMLGAAAMAETLTLEEGLALMRLSGGAIRMDGFIGETGVRSPGTILVQSWGGMETGRSAHIWLRGRDFGGSKRGFHVALIDGQTGQVFNLGLFDIWEAPEEAARMAAFLREAPPGSIGAFAVCDDASVHLSPALESEMLGFGLEKQAVIKGRPALLGLRYSFAALGVKGAAPGTALQAWSPESFAGIPGHPVACGVVHEGEDLP
jgi:hypothetical protein